MDSQKLYLGLDPSLNGYGMVVLDGAGKLVDYKLIHSGHKLTKKLMKDVAEDEHLEKIDLDECKKSSLIDAHRLTAFEVFISEVYEEYPNICGVAIEGYSHGSVGRVFQLGEIGGITRVAAYKRGITFIEVPPTTLKKFATGKGNADKIQIAFAMNKGYGIDFSGYTKSDNLFDAYALARFAYLFFALEDMNQDDIDLISKSELDSVNKYITDHFSTEANEI